MTCKNPAFSYNGKREFAPRDHVSTSLVAYCSLFQQKKLVVSRNFFLSMHKNRFELFLSARFLF